MDKLALDSQSKGRGFNPEPERFFVRLGIVCDSYSTNSYEPGYRQ